MLRARVDDNDLVALKVSLNESDPRLVAPTIAAKRPPSSKELLERKKQDYCALQACKINMWSGFGRNFVK